MGHHQTLADLVVALTGYHDEASPVSAQAQLASLLVCHRDRGGIVPCRSEFFGSIADLVRAPDSQSDGHWFMSSWA